MLVFTKLVFGVLLLHLMLAQPYARALNPQEGLPDYISAQHKAVLEKWLKQKPTLRVAVAEDLDAATMKLVEDMFPDRAASPFYAVGDFNDDGQEDFAIGLVDKSQPKKLTLAVFNGPTGKAGAPAFYDEKNFDISEPIFISADDRGRQVLQLGIGSDIRTILLKPRGKGYYLWVGATR